ncbi:MAG: PhnD/SsuA/transferrin family substrate-binding protein [Rhizobiaceae bacterium]|nr:PhnD/SsuA/transferrin family substrate-binding protein [Rhizobiaceae bacterium]MCV0406647.1 PhnD/SsuA/transferrin family substrate-binding protein [Rhizobiaceae bacterium]
MTGLLAALPMYDWPEARAETDAEWAAIRERLAAAGIDAPERLARRNADLPPVPGGIRDGEGRVVAPDPALLPPDELDLPTLWRHPALLFGQTCWGPMETTGLAERVRVVGQADYSACEGGEGALYSSAILMRRGDAPATASRGLPVEALRGARLAYNDPCSMSGILALTRDLETLDLTLDIFGGRVETGSHRGSIGAVARGEADICAVDCRTWALARRFEPAAAALSVVGWTAKRKGLPYITAHGALADRVAAAFSPTGPRNR